MQLLKEKIRMEKNRIVIFMYIVGHFAVDFACAFLLYQIIYGTEHWYPCLLYYNFCAFALQMPFGLLADRWNRNGLCAAIGCGMVALAFGLGNVTLIAAVIVAGIGNGLFHVGGGIDVLNISREKAFLLGVFVSPGALGIYLGTVFGKKAILPEGLVILVLLIIAATILAAYYAKRHSFCSDNVPVSFQGISSFKVFLAIGCLLTVVCLRSYIGMISNFPWKGRGAWGILFIGAVVFGKMAGGFLADRFGMIKASVISLVLASILYLFADYPLTGIFAVFFFNMTMPITLWALTRILKGSKGFSFGLLTFGLFLGFTPVYLKLDPAFTTSIGFTATALASLILLWIGLRKAVV
jgi:MFS transporter, FSR family, fosmidomycin resistance protein